jgi:hypothetical protein
METPLKPSIFSMAICRAKDWGATTIPRIGVPDGGGMSTWWYIRIEIGRFMMCARGMLLAKPVEYIGLHGQEGCGPPSRR